MNNIQKLVMAQRELIKAQDELLAYCSDQSRLGAIDPELIWRKYKENIIPLKKKTIKLEGKIIEEEKIKEAVIGYCAKCAAKMKLKDTRYVCMNPECDNYLKTE